MLRRPRLDGRVAGTQRRGGTQKDRVAGHDARIVIDDGGQPRPLRLTVGIENQDIELGVVGLPGRIRGDLKVAAWQCRVSSSGCESRPGNR